MNSILSLMIGSSISLLILFNGQLSTVVGSYEATILYHFVAFVILAVMRLFIKYKGSKERIPFYYYLAGLFSVATIIFNNISFGKISVSAILAIGLLGQAIVSVIVDHFALFGAKKQKFDTFKLIGFSIVMIGVLILTLPLNAGSELAVFVTFLTGFTVVLNRIYNAELAKRRDHIVSAFWNFLIGSIGTALCTILFFGKINTSGFTVNLLANPVLYLGAIFGIVSVLIANYVTPRIASYYLTLFIFIGQIFTGIICDIALDQSFSLQNFLGGIFVLAGLCFNLYIDNRKNKKA